MLSEKDDCKAVWLQLCTAAYLAQSFASLLRTTRWLHICSNYCLDCMLNICDEYLGQFRVSFVWKKVWSAHCFTCVIPAKEDYKAVWPWLCTTAYLAELLRALPPYPAGQLERYLSALNTVSSACHIFVMTVSGNSVCLCVKKKVQSAHCFTCVIPEKEDYKAVWLRLCTNAHLSFASLLSRTARWLHLYLL